MHSAGFTILGTALAFTATSLSDSRSSSADSEPSPVRVEIETKGDSFRLTRGGKPFFVKGAGGRERLGELADAGGNSIRTWDVGDDTGKLLDEAQEAGLTVNAGIWLQRVGTGFDYGSQESLEGQREKVRRAVERFRDHPAVLMWSLGNEGEADGQDPRYYEHLEELAQLVHELDPNHPVMTVISELGPGGKKIRDLERLAPSLDVIGINSYGGVKTVPERYRRAGGTRPYIVTEFGPKGHWESPRTSWGTPIEMSSTEKARHYRDCYEAAILDEPTCLGAYVFLWGQKQETTATWFGMFLEDGTRLGPVDAMTEVWTGKAPSNRAPRITGLSVSSESCDPGEVLRASVDVKDPDRDRLEIEWVLRAASRGDGRWGMREDRLRDHPDAVVSQSKRSAKIRMPEEPGPYRLFVHVRDGKGSGATHNVPILVKAR